MSAADERVEVFSVTLLGQRGVGKSALAFQICFRRFIPDFDASIEDTYAVHLDVDGAPCRLVLWDTAGSQESLEFREQWISKCDGCLLVYSISDLASLETAGRLGAHLAHRVGGRPPSVVLANKCDSVKEHCTSDGEKLASVLGATHFAEVSATMYDTHLSEAISALVREMRRQRQQSGPDVRRDSGSDASKGAEEKRICRLV